jgi:hypothetical protein
MEVNFEEIYKCKDSWHADVVKMVNVLRNWERKSHEYLHHHKHGINWALLAI